MKNQSLGETKAAVRESNTWELQKERTGKNNFKYQNKRKDTKINKVKMTNNKKITFPNTVCTNRIDF